MEFGAGSRTDGWLIRTSGGAVIVEYGEFNSANNLMIVYLHTTQFADYKLYIFEDI